ncbi:unnamed protein product [Camellia sinensis]
MCPIVVALDISKDLSPIAKVSRALNVQLAKLDNQGNNTWQHLVLPTEEEMAKHHIIPYHKLQQETKAILFLMMELQSSWVAQVLSGNAHLPSKEEMLAVAQQHYQCMEECGIPKHHTHRLHPNE